jgi:hypothetical protein
MEKNIGTLTKNPTENDAGPMAVGDFIASDDGVGIDHRPM